MNKEYKPESLIKKSRFNEYYKQINQQQQDSIKKRIKQLIKENPEYCDKGNYNHISNIFTSIAIYENLQKQHTKQESYEILSQTMWYVVEKQSKTFKKLSKIPYFLKIIGKLLPYLFNKGSGYGWKYQWYNEESTNNHLKFECTKCIYQQLFKKYNKEELGPMFCYADDINYGQLENITFTRKHTLCKDGQNCDFLFTRNNNILSGDDNE